MASIMRSTVEIDGLTTVSDLSMSLVDILSNNGFSIVYPPPDMGPFSGEGTVILEPTVEVDPLYKPPVEGLVTTSWRIAFTVVGNTLNVNVATPVQLKDDGTIAKANWASEPNNPGEILRWVNRSHMSELDGAVYPMSLLVSTSDHGVFIGVWDQSTDEYQNEAINISPAFRWLLVQRAVDHGTGEVYVDGKSPVYCVYNVFESSQVQMLGGEQPPTGDNQANFPVINGVRYKTANCQMPYKFVVRESDVYRPSLMRPADVNVEDSNAIINAAHQVSIAEDNRYVVTVLKGLNTTRYAYTHELDMVAFTSADVIGQQSEIELDIYDGEPYKYRALLANRVRNTGMRILCRVAEESTNLGDQEPPEIPRP